MTALTAKTSIAPHQWQPATWEDFLSYRDDPAIEKARLSFHQGRLWIEGGEGINDFSVSNLFSMMFLAWFSQHPDQIATSLGHCQIERPRIFAFQLQEDGKYQQIEESIALIKLPINLLEQAIDRLTKETNINAALWFAQQIARSND